MLTRSDLAPPLTAGHIPQCLAGDGLAQVISHVVPEAGGEPELRADRSGEQAGGEQEAEQQAGHDVTQSLVTISRMICAYNQHVSRASASLSTRFPMCSENQVSNNVSVLFPTQEEQRCISGDW